jgi:phytoene synthase
VLHGGVRRFNRSLWTFVHGPRAACLLSPLCPADALYDEGVAGIAELRNGRRAIRAAAGMYREILRQIEREGYGMRAGRAVVPRSRKLFIAARSTV